MAGQAYVPAPAPSWQTRPTGPPASTSPTAGLTSQPPAASAPTELLFPKRVMLVFDSAQLDGIGKKLREFNAALGGGDAQLSLIDSLLVLVKDTSHYHTSAPSADHYGLLTSLLTSWPAANLFPVLDLLRMLLLHPKAAAWFAANAAGSDGLLTSALRRAAADPPLPANHLTGLRVAVNTFGQVALRDWSRSQRAEVLDLFAPCAASANKNVRLALATLLLDYAVLLVDASTQEDREEGQIQTLSAAFELAAPTEPDPEVRYRALLAIATLMHSGGVKETAVEMGAADSIEAAAAFGASPALQKLGLQMKSLL